MNQIIVVKLGSKFKCKQFQMLSILFPFLFNLNGIQFCTKISRTIEFLRSSICCHQTDKMNDNDWPTRYVWKPVLRKRGQSHDHRILTMPNQSIHDLWYVELQLVMLLFTFCVVRIHNTAELFPNKMMDYVLNIFRFTLNDEHFFFCIFP